MSNNAMEDTVVKLLIEKINSLIQTVETQKDCINRLTDICQKQQSMNDKLYDQLSKTTVNTIEVSATSVPSVPSNILSTPVLVKEQPDKKPNLKQLCESIISVKLAATKGELFAIVKLDRVNFEWIKYCNLTKDSDEDADDADEDADDADDAADDASLWTIKHCGMYHILSNNNMSFAIPWKTLEEIIPYIDIKTRCVFGVSIISHYIQYYIKQITYNGNDKFIIQLKTQLNSIVRRTLCLRYETYTPAADNFILHSPSSSFLKWGSDLINVKFE